MYPSTLPALTSWIPGRTASSNAAFRLFCFPYAGIGVSAYRSWGAALSPDIEICPVQLPGRESRQNEAPLNRLDDIVDAAATGLRPFMNVPFALFGHSMGALLAYELARKLKGNPNLRRLFVSARRAPHLAEPLAPIASLSSADFVATVQQRYGGIPAPVLACDDLLELLLPRLRADFDALETYVHRPAEPLRCGISVFGGSQDTVSEADLREWGLHTTEGARVRMLDAGHLYLESRRDVLVKAIADDIALDRRAIEVAW
jgi:surfactin synthase thioesterase subunit